MANNSENNVFVIDDGTRELKIVNNFNQPVCTVHVRITDMSIVDRFQSLSDDIPAMLEPLRGIELNNETGEPELDNDWAKIKAVEKNIIARINEVFDTDDASNFFEKRNAFSIIKGKFYMEHVIETLAKVVQSSAEKESKEMQKRVDKYVKDVKKTNE